MVVSVVGAVVGAVEGVGGGVVGREQEVSMAEIVPLNFPTS